jgi:biopolymer transport protein ExbD
MIPPLGALTPVLNRPARRKPDFSLSTVNIVLLLVLFFLIVGAPADQAERRVNLPITRTLPLAPLPRPLLLVEQGTGALVLDGIVVSPESLQAAIQSGGMERVHLMVARDHPAQAALELSSWLRAQGSEVVLVTLRPADQSAP